jgi:4-hydroxybenzoate polyprenyltransferase
MTKYLIATWKLSRAKQILGDFFIPLMLLGIVGGVKELSLNIIFGIIVNAAILFYIFAINDLEDAEDDAKDPKKAKRNPVSSGFITDNEALWILRVLALIAIVFSILSAGFWISVLALSGLLVGHLYSWKRIRLKSVPILDVASHLYMLAVVEVLYFMFLPESVLTTASWFIVFGAGLFSGGGALYNQVRDFEVDQKTKIKNTTALIGKNLSTILTFIFYISGTTLCILGIYGRLDVIF